MEFSNSVAKQIKTAMISYCSFQMAMENGNIDNMVFYGRILKENHEIFDAIGLRISAALKVYEAHAKQQDSCDV